MKARYGITALALVASISLTVPVLAAGGKGQAAQKQTRTTVQKQQRVRDGSCTQSGTQQGTKAKRGNAYGPGDGSGYQGQGPKDGTGYGAPANR